MDSILTWIRRAATSARLPIGVMSGAIAMATAIRGLGAGLGIGSLAGLVGLAAAFYAVGVFAQASNRAERRKKALVWQGVARNADPIKDFDIRRARHSGQDNPLPPFVVRNVTEEFEQALLDEGLVVLKGDRPSGKSRLIYEILRSQHRTRVLVSGRASSGAKELIELMNDPRGVTRWRGQTVLLIRDSTELLISGELTAEMISRWLDHQQHRAIIVTFNDADLKRIAKADTNALTELARLEKYGHPISLDACLSGLELEKACERFPELSTSEREHLPEYLSSAAPLRERFRESASGQHALGHAITRAVADWRLAGIERPTPRRYIHSATGLYAPLAINSDFTTELAWACETVEAVVRLVKECDGGYVPDTIVLDLIVQRYGRELQATVWRAIRDELRQGLEDALSRETAVDELITLGLTAGEYGDSAFAKETIDEARQFASGIQEDRIEQQTTPRPEAGSPRALVDTRFGDSVRHRVAEAQRPLKIPANKNPPASSWEQFIAWIYRRRGPRNIARLATLVIIDAFSMLLGLFVALLVRAEFDDHSLSSVEYTIDRFLVLWIAVAVLALARLGLYRQDAPRARLSPMLIVTGMLGGIGMIAAWGADRQLGSIPAVATGCLVAVLISYQLRARYDSVSRTWVRNHKLEARTLLIGTREQAQAMVQALSSISRPTKVVGYITIAPEPSRNPHDFRSLRHLGSALELPTILYDHSISRIIIVDPNLDVRTRRELADPCHERELHVEAVPSLADIRDGRAEPVIGQSLVLVHLKPLWPGDAAFVAKRVLDLLLGSIGMLALAVMWPALLIAARIEGGTVLVESKRYGMGKRKFLMYRFRTTRPGAPTDANDGAEPMSELTRFGRFLRQRGLDELPQLLNVLRGDMAIVGPRPLHPSDHALLDEEQQLRYVVRPGMTGPWLVSGDTRLSRHALTALDFSYLAHWTLFVDLDILIKTLRLAVRGRPELPGLKENLADSDGPSRDGQQIVVEPQE